MMNEIEKQRLVGWVDTEACGRVYVHLLPDGTREVVMTAATAGDKFHLSSEESTMLSGLLRSGPSFPAIETAISGGENVLIEAQAETTHSTGDLSKRRRESVADLVGAGLVSAGETLTMIHAGEKHEASVLHDGSIAVKADGAAFLAPSSAARHITGNASEPGWDRWRTISGKTLADLRWELRTWHFPPDPDAYSESHLDEMRRVIRRWVAFAREHGTSPVGAQDPVVEEFLHSPGFAPSTVASYRRHLVRWFNEHGNRR